MKKLLILSFLALFSQLQVLSQTLIHYWNFNNTSTLNDHLTPSTALVSGSGITHQSGGISTIDLAGGTGQNFNVLNLNARNGDASGNHLRFNDPIGGGLVFSLPSTGYKDIMVKYATRRSGSGAGWQMIEYSTDGSTFTFFDTIVPNNGDPQLATLDFTGITAANENANFKIRITFEQGPGGTVGNNRFDNFTMEGNSASGTDNLPPTVVFAPTDNSNYVDISILPTLTFNENIRLLNNTSITNADTLVEFRMNDSTGTPVSFTTNFANNTITLVPSSALLYNQKYYVALKGNRIEDLNNNAITEKQFITFTCTPQQTVFQPGDIVPVAYRMNATATDDEVAFLTFVSILPGTRIQFTDAKHTDNTQAQCAGGLTWTAPSEGVAAGTVFTIKNDVGTASIGTISGSSFGLSSGGDQMIVYTGTPQNPMFITALSSNAWVANNTSCSGSLSKIPSGLADGTNAINLSTAPGNTTGNTVNAFYKGTQNGTYSLIKDSVLNPLNWIGVGSGTAAQVWPEWNFPGPPSITKAFVENQTTIKLIYNRDMETSSVTNLGNYTGIAGLAQVFQSSNGTANDTITLVYASPFANNTPYTLEVKNIKDSEGRSIFGTYTYSFTYATKIAFAKQWMAVNENAGTVSITLNVEFPSAASIDLVVKPAPFSTATPADFILNSQTLSLNNNIITINIPITDDNISEQDEFLLLSLENSNGTAITGNPYFTLYIKDNENKGPVASNEISLKHITSFDPNALNGSTTEIVAFDPTSKRIFTTSAIEDRLDISDFSNPATPVLVKSVDMTPYGGITSVAVKNGIVAVASPNANEQLNGSVVFFNTNGEFLKQVTVGALPDMVVFTPDGKKVLTANEGQPSVNYSIDPEGSVSVIDISGGIANLTQNNVTTLFFDGFNSSEAALIASGVRKLKLSSTLSQDFEPEYITISDDSKKAWVTLQENNAIGEIDLETMQIVAVWALGTKNMNLPGNGFDASDNNNEVLLSNWPVKAFYIPDAVANYSVGGTTYLVTANEGDEKEYTGLNERTTVGAASYILDSTAYPNSNFLKLSHNLGRLRVTNLNGDFDNDGDFDQIFMVGTRSFSIWNPSTQSLVYDSGDDFEQYTSKSPVYAPVFNADNEGNAMKGRSRAKGPEPEGITVAQINDAFYAFITLERIGGVMVYNITNPANPVFVTYNNTRNLATYGGDNGPEGIIFIPATESPNGKPYILVANELSGTITVYEVTINTASATTTENLKLPFMIYPNPSNGIVYFNQTVTFDVTDLTGKIIASGNAADSLVTTGLSKGIYLIRTTNGAVAKLIIE